MNNEVKMTGITITKEQFANDYTIIDSEGIITGIKATGQNNPYFNDRIADSPKGKDYEKTILVNLKAIEARKVSSVLALFQERDSIDIAELKNLTYVHTINLNKGQEVPRLPMRNQEVTLQFFYATKNGEQVADTNGELIFNSSQLQVPEPRAAKKFTFDLIPEKEEEVKVEFGEEITA